MEDPYCALQQRCLRRIATATYSCHPYGGSLLRLTAAIPMEDLYCSCRLTSAVQVGGTTWPGRRSKPRSMSWRVRSDQIVRASTRECQQNDRTPADGSRRQAARRDSGGGQGEPWPAAALPMESPYCSCRLTRLTATLPLPAESPYCSCKLTQLTAALPLPMESPYCSCKLTRRLTRPRRRCMRLTR